MRYVDEYRNPEVVKKLISDIKSMCTREWHIMEVCGGQTHAFLRFGLDEALYPEVQMIHGPGCPVCVTPVDKIDTAISLAMERNILLCSFGDMLRVPGTGRSLLSARAEGGNVQTVYSPLDAVEIASKDCSREVVFFAVGFETTAPINALSVKRAKELGLKNYSILCAQVLVPPAIEALLSDSTSRIDGFLSAGHVCTVMGYWEYEPIAEKYKKPIVVTGFEPVDLLLGVKSCVEMLESGRYGVDNAYSRSVRREGNKPAQELMKEIFEVCDREWRGIGMIPNSGLKLRYEYVDYDAEVKFAKLVSRFSGGESVCIAGEVLQGKRKPSECSAFGKECTPENPLGAPMVSNEGACSAYYQYYLGRKG